MTATGEDKLLHQWFHDGLAANPDGAALRVGSREWTYREVHELATAWAAALCADRPPRRVGILAAKSPEAYIGLLATLYSGATAVPLGPDNPLERNAAVCQAAGVDALVVDGTGAERLPGLLPLAGAPAVLAPSTDLPIGEPVPLTRNGGTGSPPARRSPDDLAYILFTSGSTGAPKGVPISHRNVSSFLASSLVRYDVGPDDRFSQIYELTFDLAMFDIFMAWGVGACVCALTRLQALNPARCVRGHGLTVWHTTPSLVGAVRDLVGPGDLAGLRYTVFCGEPLPTGSARLWRAAAPAATLDNIYGPTELTIACTAYRWATAEPVTWTTGTVPIGYPNDGMDFLLLGENDEPDSTAGELCMAGPQMFAGYLDPANDAGRFHERDGRRWYRTGDRVELTEEFGLVHLGRNDSQVKIQGYRVELAEVETVLGRLVPDADVAVFALPDGDTQVLVAFVLGGGPVAESELVTRLAEHLPTYMLPRHLWALDTAPLNENGKLDRRGLRDLALRTLSGQD